MAVETKSVWDHLDIALPDLEVALKEVETQGKGSTEWAAHSHSPVRLQQWDNFDELIAVESEKTENQKERNLIGLRDVVKQFLPWNKVKEEEDITDRTLALLNIGTKDDFNLWGEDTTNLERRQNTSLPSRISSQREKTMKSGVQRMFLIISRPRRGGKQRNAAPY